MNLCEYCHEDVAGYVTPIEKNCHVFMYGSDMVVKANGWRKNVPINFCPMCGRRLRDCLLEEKLDDR